MFVPKSPTQKKRTLRSNSQDTLPPFSDTTKSTENLSKTSKASELSGTNKKAKSKEDIRYSPPIDLNRTFELLPGVSDPNTVKNTSKIKIKNPTTTVNTPPSDPKKETSQIKSLQLQIKTLQESEKKNKALINQLKKEVQQYQSVYEENSKLQEIEIKNKKRINHLEKELFQAIQNSQNKNQSNLEGKTIQDQNQIKQLQSQNRHQSEKIEELEEKIKQLEDQDNHYTELTQKYVIDQTRIADFIAKEQLLNDEITSLKNKQSEQQEKNSDFFQKFLHTQTENSIFTQKEEQLNEHIKKLEYELEKYIDINSSSTQNSQTRITDLEKELQETKQLLEKQKQVIKDQHKSINELKRQESANRSLNSLENPIENIPLPSTSLQISTSNNYTHSNPSNISMEIPLKDLINSIPTFDGNNKDLNSFINTCTVYNDLTEEAQKPTLLKIIKAKLTGEALAKLQPLDNLTTWALLRESLKTKLRKPISYDFAKEELNNVFQKDNETTEEYGQRVRSKLTKLNEAIRTITTEQAEVQILRKTHEKAAISKFQQNLKNEQTKVIVKSAQKTTLDECIAYALEQELLEKTSNVKKCNFCKIMGHTEDECRKKQNASNSISPNREQFNRTTSFQNRKRPNSLPFARRRLNFNDQPQRKSFNDFNRPNFRPNQNSWSPNNSRNFYNKTYTQPETNTKSNEEKPSNDNQNQNRFGNRNYTSYNRQSTQSNNDKPIMSNNVERDNRTTTFINPQNKTNYYNNNRNNPYPKENPRNVRNIEKQNTSSIEGPLVTLGELMSTQAQIHGIQKNE